VKGKRLQIAMLRPAGSITLRYKAGNANARLPTRSVRCSWRSGGPVSACHRRYPRRDGAQLTSWSIRRSCRWKATTSRRARPIGEVRLTHRLFEDPNADQRGCASTSYGERAQPACTGGADRAHRQAALQGCTNRPPSPAPRSCSTFPPGGLPRPRASPFRSELAVTAAASLASAVLQMGQQVGLVTKRPATAVDRIRLGRLGTRSPAPGKTARRSARVKREERAPAARWSSTRAAASSSSSGFAKCWPASN